MNVSEIGLLTPRSVSAGQRACFGNAPAARFLKSPAIALLQSALRQRQSAQLILTEWVRARDIKQKLGTKIIERLLHGRQQRAEIFIAVNAIHHVEIDVRGRLVRAVVVFLADVKRYYR